MPRYPSSVDRAALKKLLEGVRRGRVSIAQAEDQLRHFPTGDLGFASIDTHRLNRRLGNEARASRGRREPPCAALPALYGPLKGRTRTIVRLGLPETPNSC